MSAGLDVADVFRRHGELFCQTHAGHIGRVERRVMGAITACRTAALGGHVEQCDDCGATRIAYNSCRNRHCPKCQGAARERWLAERRGEVLPIPYFHVVFTLPPAAAEIAFQNKAAVYAILFRSAAAALMKLAANPRHLEAELGILAVLHTWGQTLQHHPHIHCVIPGGGPSLDGQRWVSCKPGFFLPVRPLARLFRGMFLAELGAAFEAGDLKFFGDLTRLAAPQAFAQRLADLRGADWVVYAKPPFGGPEQVLAYLARYTHRVAIANSRIVSLDDGRVGFTWKNYRCAGQTKVMTLEAHVTSCPMASTASAITDTSPTEVALTISPAAGASSANARSTRSRSQQIGIAAATIHHLEIVFRFPVPNAAALFAASLRSRPIRGAVHPFTATRHEHRPCVRQARRFRHGELRTRDRSRLALHLVANRTPTRITTKPSRTMPDPTRPATDNSPDPLDAIRRRARRRASRRRSDTAFPIAANIPRLRSIRLL